MPTASLAKKTTVRASHQQAARVFFGNATGPFRRADLAKMLYPLTSPRSNSKADQLADRLVQDAARDGTIERHGHQHWVRVQKVRTLRSGRVVSEMAETMELSLTTHCPKKWLALDLESGEVWAASAKGWQRASSAQRQEAKDCLE